MALSNKPSTDVESLISSPHFRTSYRVAPCVRKTWGFLPVDLIDRSSEVVLGGVVLEMSIPILTILRGE